MNSKNLAAGTLAMLCLMLSASPQQECDGIAACVCAMKLLDTTPADIDPPACFESVTAVFNAGTAENGCCTLTGCTASAKLCKYQIVLTATAKSGQTCNFQFVIPGTPQPPACQGQSSCGYTNPNVKSLTCGRGDDYALKVNGVTVGTWTAKCKLCDGPI